jgi:hypothetical protein
LVTYWPFSFGATPYLPRSIVSHLGWPRPSTCWKGEIGGGVTKSGGQPEIIKVCYCNGCVQVQNCNGLG